MTDWNQFITQEASPKQSVDWSQFTPQESGIQKFNEAVSDPIIALGQGTASGLLDFGKDVGGLTTQILGYISPSLEQKLNNYGNTVKNTLEQKGQYQDVNEAHPILNAIGKGVGYTGGLIGAGAALTPEALPESASVLAKTINTGTNVAGQGLLGSAMAGEGNRVSGFIGGAAVPAAAEAVGTVGNFFAANAKQGKEIEDLVSKINSAPNSYKNMNIYDATDEAFKQFRTTPGEINAQVPKTSIQNYLAKYEDRLTAFQATSLKNSIDDINNAKTLEDVHNARKDFSSALNRNFLTGKDQLNGPMRKELLQTQKVFESTLKHNANELGVLDKYNEANKLFKQSQEADIINNAFDKTKLPQGGNNFLNFNRTIMKLKDSQSNKLSPDTKEMLTGIQRTAEEANHILGVDVSSNIHIGMANLAISGLKTISQVPGLKPVLQYAGTEGGKEVAHNIAKAILNYGQAKVIAPILQERYDTLFGNGENK